MTRNQKIALGCGGAGCLGLIVVVIAASLIYFFAYRSASSRASRDYDFNVNLNRNSNSGDNSNSNTDSNDNTSSSDSASSLSDDDKHKLFQAAMITGDTELINRVNTRIGIWNEDNTPGDNYESFVTAHAGWAFRNLNFIRSINTPEKARAYIDANLPN